MPLRSKPRAAGAELAAAVPAPAAPVITSITFDQPAYSPGQTITATVTFTPGTSASTTSFSGTATDSVTAKTGKLSVTFTTVIPDATTVSVADTGNHAWTQTSATGGTQATFTATA